MPNIACPKCSAQYKLPDNLIGKPVKCPKCSTAFKVGKKSTKKTASPAQPATQPAAATQTTADQAKAQELAKLGLDGPISKNDPIFDSSESTANPQSNPLGQVAINPGFVGHSSAADNEADAQPMGDMFENPALEKNKKRSTKSHSDSKTGSGKSKGKPEAFSFKTAIKEIWFMLLLGLGLITLLGVLLPLIFSGAAVMQVIGLSLVNAAGLGVHIWGSCVAYKHSSSTAVLLLCLLVPFYIFYYTYTNWEVMSPFLKATVVCLVMGLIFVPFMIFGAGSGS